MATEKEVQAMKDAVETNFPGINDKGLDSLLWGATAFPMGSPQQICRQIREKRQQIDGLRAQPSFQSDQSDVELALTIADAEITACMKSMKSRKTSRRLAQ